MDRWMDSKVVGLWTGGWFDKWVDGCLLIFKVMIGDPTSIALASSASREISGNIPLGCSDLGTIHSIPLGHFKNFSASGKTINFSDIFLFFSVFQGSIYGLKYQKNSKKNRKC